MGIPNTYLTACDLCVSHFMCAGNYVLDIMYAVVVVSSITSCIFCNFPICFSHSKIFFLTKIILFHEGIPISNHCHVSWAFDVI